jgi:two-component system NtrC family sensor kinase
VFLNLINNAIDAVEKKGGKVVLRSRLENHGPLAPNILIDVEDNGQGIPTANLGRVFDPFFTTKPVGKGTGLGLSICFGIINKMGGQITVESTVDVGTTFHVRIPLPKETSAGSPNSREGTSPG